MELIVYLTFFIIGTLFGSFFTLAVYRIPLGKNITHERSFCPNCNHKLQFLDLIPILSYIFLGGKCRYCGEKIRPRYFIFELLTGIIFAFYAYTFRINFLSGFDEKIILLVFGLLYFTALLIIAGIDKEKIQIQSSVLIYLLIINMLYMIYVCTFKNENVYGYVIYLFVMAICVLTNTYFIKTKLRTSYVMQLFCLIINIAIFSGVNLAYLTILLATVLLAIYLVIKYLIQRINKIKIKENKLMLPIGFYLCISNIVVILINNFLVYK